MAVPFGKYQLLKKIASGGMGQVFLARQGGAQGFEKLVVIKRILPHLVEDEEFITMFFDEARIAARLNHPNLVQIFDLGEANNSHYLAMEYVPGEDLRRVDILARKSNKPLGLGLLCRIIADAAAGLDYAHKAKDARGTPLGLVHRDVSPQNILVGFDGGVKLIDFGVAKAAGRSQHTATGILKGKYPYMSPEQVAGQEIDSRSDVFGLGIVFWECLTGKRLFRSENDFQTMRLIADCQVPLPSRLNPRVPSSLDEVVMRALTKSVDERYQTAAELRLAIEEVISTERLQGSSAHLVPFLHDLYGDRVNQADNLEELDELMSEADLFTGAGAPPSGPSAQVNPPAAGGQRTASLSAIPAQRGSGPKLLIGLAAFALIAGGAALVAPRLRAKPVPIPVADVLPVPEALPPPPPPAADPAPAREVAITLASEPPGASVSVDGKNFGVTPVAVMVPEGAEARNAVFTLDGFEAREAAFSAKDGPELKVQLEKKKAGTRKKPPRFEIKTGR